MLRSRLMAATSVTALVCGLATTSLAPASAEPLPDQTAVAVTDAQLAPEGTILTRRSDAPVLPGVRYTSFERMTPTGWQRGDLMTLDLTNRGYSLGHVNSGVVAKTDTLTDQLTGAGAVAGVNADGFDINDTGAANGGAVDREGNPVAGYSETAAHRRTASLVMGKDGLAEFAQLFLDASAGDGEVTHTIEYLNSPQINPGEIGLFTSSWGEPAVSRTFTDNSAAGWQVLLRDGVVASSGPTVDAAKLADNEQALVGYGNAVAELDDFTVGERVTVNYTVKGADDIASAVNTFFVVAVDGKVVSTNTKDLHPRTVVALTNDGTRMALMTIDGRMAASRGMTEVETAEFFLNLGYDDVYNFDGGGSSQLNARLAGNDQMTIRSMPSDGQQRHTANSVGLFPKPGSGTVAGFNLAVTNRAGLQADTDESRDFHVLTGLSRVVSAEAYDNAYAPLDGKPTITVPGGNATVAAGENPEQAVLTGATAGSTTVVAAEGAATDEHRLVVLGKPIRLSTDTTQVSLPAKDQTGSFQVFGHDERGFNTWVEPRDVKLSYDETQVRIEPAGDRFQVTSLVDAGAAVITVEAAGLSTQVAATINLATTEVDEMDSTSVWSATTYPAQVKASASVATGKGRDGGDAIAFDYSLTGTTATRAAYLQMNPRASLTGAPQKLGVWVHGDGKGAWLRANFYESTGGAPKTVNFDYITWTGWKYVEADIPAGLNMPLSFYRFYVVETVGSKQYAGQILLDDMTVRSAPELPPLEIAKAEDPHVITEGSLPEGDWRYAVLSDAQFTSDNPNSDIVAQARRTLREALAAKPEFIVIDGDFVDRGFAGDIALAKQIIDEEVGDKVPLHYVPGNHEAAGPGNLDEWVKVFGEPARTFDHKGTRFILRSTPGYSLISGGFEQITDLKEQLDAAAKDPAINNVMVIQHHPMTEPGGPAGSTLKDPREVEMLSRWLREFRMTSGKGVALQGAGVGTFDATTTDSVTQLINGNAGKSPAGAPGEGGFTGWTLVGINPRPAVDDLRKPVWGEQSDWLRVLMVPHVDKLELSAPEVVEAGEPQSITATVVQGGRRVPVDYPVAGTWAFDQEVDFDAATGQLTARKPGALTISVTVSGVTASKTVLVSGAHEPTPVPTATATATVTASPTATATVTASPTATVTVHPTATATATVTAAPIKRVAPYEVPGFHVINGRTWYTTCEPYSQTMRCQTEIWSKQVLYVGGKYVVKQGWFFNNLTYLPFMTRAQWGSNPLARAGTWTAGGRKFKTECDSAVTGRNACRSYIWGTKVEARPIAPGKYSYRLVEGWVFNNIVRFKV